MRQRLADAALSRVLRQPDARNAWATTPVRTPLRDGVVLLGDHYAPVGAASRGTILIRTPYGRGLPGSALQGRVFAARGYHVLIQSVRGTFGSGGTFRAMAQETEDGTDTVAWLRDQSWFDGRLATMGASYLGWTQWTLMQDPPPELRAAVVLVGPHDFRRAVFGTGAFTLGDFLGWSDQIANQEGSNLHRLLTMATSQRRLRPAYDGLPLTDASDPLLRGRAPWYREWLQHPDPDDPWWGPYCAGAALDRVDVPILLIGGWQDLFVDQTIEQYEALSARGVPVGLTVGPWTHFEVGAQASPVVTGESLAWLDEHLADGPPARPEPVRAYRTGENRWHDLPSWPPPTAPAVFQLHTNRTLSLSTPPRPTTAPQPTITQPIATQPTAAQPPTAPPGAAPSVTAPSTAAPQPGGDPEPAGAAPAVVSFRYDPRDPTPTVGGRTLLGSPGVKDNRALEARADVLTFTTDPLPTAVDVIGSPTVEIAVALDGAHGDLFLRLCDVDERGRSRNFADLLHRLDPSIPPGETRHLALTLDPCFHRLAAGHRLRLQVSGGSFPRYARNLGTAGTPAQGRTLQPSVHTLRCADSRLILPIATTP